MRWKILVILVLVLAMALLSAYVLYPVTTAAAPGEVGNAETPQTNVSGVTTREIRVVMPVWASVVLGVLSLTTLISVVVTFYLYRWRRILLATPNLLVPEEWGQYLRGIGRHVDKLTGSFERGIGDITTKTSENSAKLTNMVETFMTLQAALDEKDTEIRRFKKGYDVEVFRKFLSRFIRIDQSINDLIETEHASQESLEQIKRLLEDAFDECGVEIFQPTVGDDYRTARGIADNPKTEKTKRSEDAFKIAEILGTGYRLRHNEGYEVIVPARVKIFLCEE